MLLSSNNDFHVNQNYLMQEIKIDFNIYIYFYKIIVIIFWAAFKCFAFENLSDEISKVGNQQTYYIHCKTFVFHHTS